MNINKDHKFLLNQMRTNHNSVCLSTMVRATCIRQIKCFPARGNQSRIAYLVYNEFNQIILAVETRAICDWQLKEEKPKRIAFIRDQFYISQKDFKQYLSYADRTV